MSPGLILGPKLGSQESDLTVPEASAVSPLVVLALLKLKPREVNFFKEYGVQGI